MGLLDGIVGNVLGSVLGGGSGQNAQSSALLQSLIGMLTSGSGGGLASILGHLKSGGLTEAVSSWVSTGPNQPVTGEQLKGALPPEILSQLASKVGLDPNQAAQGLAQVLPSLVDRLSPNGELPGGNGLQDALGGFAKMFSNNG